MSDTFCRATPALMPLTQSREGVGAAKLPLLARAGAGRRKGWSPPGSLTVHATHLALGTVVGAAVGTYGYLLARRLFGPTAPLLPHLWWLTIAVTSVALAVIKSQMDSVREAVFVHRVDGEVRQFRRRRRPEVVSTVVRRGLVAAVVAVGLAAAALWAMLRSRPGFHGFSDVAAALPRLVGPDVFLVMFAGALGVLVLGLCELTVRLTQKEGFAWQGACLFGAATATAGLSMLNIAGLAG